MDNPNFLSSQYIPRSIILDIINEIVDFIPKFNEKNHFFSHSSKKEESTVDHKSIQYHSNRILIKDIINEQDKQDKEKIIYNNSTTTTNKTIHTWQPKVLKQRKNGSCGYYCLYNSLSILNSCFIGEIEECQLIYSQLENRVLFWHFYWISINLFLEKSKKNNGKRKNIYPWNEKCILKGVLERSYVDYMFHSNNDNIISRQHYPITVLPDWAIQSLKNNRLPIDEIKEMDRISQLFKTSKNYTHVFMIGQAVHWITIVINKVDNHSELILMDSRNHDLLGSSEEDLMVLVNKHPELSEHMRKSYWFSLFEPKILIQILKDCMLGDADLTKTLLELNLSGFLDNFYSHVNQNNNNNNNNNNNILSIFNNISTTTTTTTTTTTITPTQHQQQQLIYWLENYWPPSVIEYNICQVLDSIITCREDMNKYLECHILESLSIWIKSTSDHLKNHSDVKVIQRFEITMKWFHQKFLTFQ